MAAGCRQTAELEAAADPLAASLPGSRPGSRHGCSWLSSAVRLIPAMEGLLGRMRHLAMFSPRVEAVVDDKTRQMDEREIGCDDRGAISSRPRKQLTGRLHRRFLHERDFVLLHELPPPGIDLLVDIDLHRADVAAAAVQRRGEGQVAVLTRVEGRIDDEADGTRVGGAVA